MKEELTGLIIGISIGVVIGVVLAITAMLCIRYHWKRSQIGNSSSQRAIVIPIHTNGADSRTVLSDSTLGSESPAKSGRNGTSFCLDGFKSSNVVSAFGITEFSYKDLQKATNNFTTLIGQGAFGPVYKAQMSTGETFAVKVLATNSKEGEKEFHTEVADFGLSREGMVDQNASIRGTFGYLDPEYISSGTLTKKSDVYSYGVFLFELIAGRNPQQGLMEQVELAAMDTEGKVGWEEIIDSRLDVKCDFKELNEVAALAYKCINLAPRKRPSMRDIVQVLTRIHKSKRHKNNRYFNKCLSSIAEEVSVSVDQPKNKNYVTDHRRDESIDSAADIYD
ncbi:unnamed protein product [Lupinus luteus]|uniref:Protein kinase domain-containing protein n=1 Tax=Lupinus luteus TaxID=3873 RepID=A0AAV1XQH6_LUPLU